MSRERRVSLAGLVALIVVCGVLLVVSGAAFGEGDDDSTELVDQLNEYQTTEGDWDDGMELTTMTGYTNSIAPQISSVYVDFSITAMDWTMDNYGVEPESPPCGYQVPVGEESVTSEAWITLTEIPEETIAIKDFQEEVRINLKNKQGEDGSWHNNIGETALATYSLARTGSLDNMEVKKGIDWLLENEDKEDKTWGSISDDSKAILALDSAGIDMWEEIAALMLKQRPDGSFGGVEETSWAVIALSTSPNEETMLSMERAMAWLRNQDYENTEDLANAALAEQYYENSQDSWDPPQGGFVKEGGSQNGLIPPPLLFIISIFIIGALVLSYFLFARLEKDAALSGVRKDIYTYIAEHPGEHLAQITKIFDISSSSARYHLSVLEGMDQIVSHKMGKFKRFYINKNGYSKYTNGNGYKHIMSALKNVTARKIVKFLLSHPNANQKSVSRALKLHPSTVNWHAERLREVEIINKNKKGKEIVYNLNEDVQVRKVIRILEGIPA
jgi:predicted transcriptional regulator